MTDNNSKGVSESGTLNFKGGRVSGNTTETQPWCGTRLEAKFSPQLYQDYNVTPIPYPKELKPELINIFGFGAKFKGVGGGLSFRYHRDLGAKLSFDASVIFGGTIDFTYDKAIGEWVITTNGYANYSFGLHLGALGLGIGSHVGVVLDDGTFKGELGVDYGTVGINIEQDLFPNCPDVKNADLPTASPFANPPRIDPLILDLDGDGIELVSVADSTAFFDMNVDGFAERTGWVDKDDGLLVIDTNGNDRIDDGSELFGDQAGFAHGFAQLAALNLNHNEGNGTIAGHNILLQSHATMTDGSQRALLDIQFATNTAVSEPTLPDNFVYHPDALSMPVLWGYGQISNTWVALS